MAGNTVTLTFAGDADKLVKEAKRANMATQGVADEAAKSAKALDNNGKSTTDLGTKMGHLGSTVSGAADALDAISGATQALVDLQNHAAEKASKQARALDDVRQAQLDLNQAYRDSKQAALDSEQAAQDVAQAQLDAQKAQNDYADAVKKYGKNSVEAQQAALDLKQAGIDVKQAQEDQAQAAQDASQANQDATTASHDLTDAQREARQATDPSKLQQMANALQVVTPLLSAAVAIVGLVTAAQWLWNASLLANPITWIVIAVIALIAVIVLVATKTKFFQTVWEAVWGFLKGVGAWFAGPFAGFFVDAWNLITGAFKAAWDWIKNIVTSGVLWVHSKVQFVQAVFAAMVSNLKGIFARVKDFITSPFRAAFNYVASAWNSTIGRLHWTVPSWVPFVGGNSISAPTLPHFHTGGVVSGALGSETLAVLRAGEKVTGGSNSAEPMVIELRSDGSRWTDFLISELKRAVSRQGGNSQLVFGNSRG